jgi:3-methylcrotonyl-CoA carboxylase beta subunit
MINKKIYTSVNINSETFKSNFLFYTKLLQTFHLKTQQVVSNSNNKAVTKHKERGKLLARERINMLIDRGTPFIELSTLAAIDQYDNDFP